VNQTVYSSVWDLFEAIRAHARQTGDPEYKPINFSSKTGYGKRNVNAKHRVPQECVVSVGIELVIVPEGTEVVLYQDPELGWSSISSSHSIGTLYLQDVQITLRGNGHVNKRDMEKWRQRTSMFGFRRGSRSNSSPDESYHGSH
jgi:hypothetical protein